jgi:hypothetical protein
MKDQTNDEPAFDVAALNLTELVAICKEAHPDAHRALPRELLELVALGVDVALPPRFVNRTRLKIMNYVNENWTQVEYQINCPAQSRDPHACFNCSDLQVADCTLSNTKLILGDD